jgi:hypothetical protein
VTGAACDATTPPARGGGEDRDEDDEEEPPPHPPSTATQPASSPDRTTDLFNPDMLIAADIPTLCATILRKNWREGVRQSDGVPFAYTCPSPGHYPWQWYWDSCFTAIVWRRFDPERARRELESLLAVQAPDGFIGHTIFWEPLTGVRRFTYNVIDPRARMTSSIQPPLLAWAWSIAVGDPGTVPGISAHHDWFQDNRDLDGDGLIWIVQPDESGLDSANQFDPIWGPRAHGLPLFVTLVQRNRRLGYNLRQVIDAGGPVCAEVATNVLYNLSRLALGQASLTETLIERCYDEDRALFMPLVRPAENGQCERRDVPVTWAALSPLALPDLPEDIGRRLVEEHLLDPDRFWLPYGPPSVDATEPSFSLADGPRLGGKRYWRGPTWVNASWLLWGGLNRLGYTEEADELARRVASAVTLSGLREYYDPYDGRGMGAVDFAWSALVMELISSPVHPPVGTV